MIRFKTRTTGFRETKRALERVGQFCRDPVRTMYNRLSKALSAEIVNAFRGRYDPQRGRRRWRRKVDGSPATLVRTGRMIRALTRTQAWQLLGPKRMIFNPARSVYYWRFHQSGTRNMPRRGVMPARKRITELVQREFDRELDVRWR